LRDSFNKAYKRSVIRKPDSKANSAKWDQLCDNTMPTKGRCLCGKVEVCMCLIHQGYWNHNPLIRDL